MRVKFKELIHGVEGQSEFKATIIHSKTSEKGYSLGIKKLIQEIKDSGDEGVIFAGDWENQPMQFLKVIEKFEPLGLGVTIGLDCSFDDFKRELGVVSFEKVEKVKLKRESNPLDDDPMLGFIGAVILDYYLRYTDYTIISKEGNERRVWRIKKALDREGLTDGE